MLAPLLARGLFFFNTRAPRVRRERRVRVGRTFFSVGLLCLSCRRFDCCSLSGALRVTRSFVVSVRYGRLLIPSTFRGLPFVRRTGLIHVAGHQRPIYGRSHHAIARRILRDLLRRTFQLNIRHQDHLIRSRSQQILRGNAYGASALTLSTQRLATTIASVDVMSVFTHRSGVVHVNSANHLLSLFRYDPFRSRESVVRGYIIGGGHLLISVPRRTTRVMRNHVARVHSISHCTPLIRVVRAERRVRRHTLSQPQLTSRHCHISFQGHRIGTFRRPFVLMLRPSVPMTGAFHRDGQFQVLEVIGVTFHLRSLVSTVRENGPFLGNVENLTGVLHQVSCAMGGRRMMSRDENISQAIATRSRHATVPRRSHSHNYPRRLTREVHRLLTTMGTIHRPPGHFITFLGAILCLHLHVRDLSGARTARHLLCLARRVPPLLLSLRQFPFRLLSSHSRRVSNRERRSRSGGHRLPTSNSRPSRMSRSRSQIFRRRVGQARSQDLSLIRVSQGTYSCVPLPLFQRGTRERFHCLTVSLITSITSSAHASQSRHVGDRVRHPSLRRDERSRRGARCSRHRKATFHLSRIKRRPGRIIFRRFQDHFPNFRQRENRHPVHVNVNFIASFGRSVRGQSSWYGERRIRGNERSIGCRVPRRGFLVKERGAPRCARGVLRI